MYLMGFLVSLLLKSIKASSNKVSKSSSSSHSALALDALDCFLESMMPGAKCYSESSSYLLFTLILITQLRLANYLKN